MRRTVLRLRPPVAAWRVLALFALAALHPGPAAAQRVVVVGPDGPVRTLAEALRRVEPGGRIVVRGGHYAEPTLTVDRPVEIVGEGWPVLDGAGRRQIMTVTADDVTIRGLVLRGVPVSFRSELAAVRVQSASRCIIEGNRFEGDFFAVYLARTHGCRVEGNRIAGSGAGETENGNGVHLWYSDGALIRGNEITGHRDGIYLEFVDDSRIEQNRSERNRRYGLHFMYSNRCGYRGNLFRRNGAGVAVMYSKGVGVVGNRFEDNWGGAAYGILLKEISGSVVERNLFLRNSTGVHLEGGGHNNIRANRLVGNGWAVKLMASSTDNEFTGNTFVGNTFDVATNSRDNESRFESNYWDAYRGYDLDHDGVGDVPFHPVRLFSLLVEQHPPLLILLRSAFVTLLDRAEQLLPSLTPETLVDPHPSMHEAS
ncbi:MAG TPA: nitrous oxide reductase family maturation protein NosD [Longimicrobiaceae bacterium]|nr:nitrous oxide reductase family maturation protein NosD [Longimicrobiaceae bacterium]